jgi:hypothetical protein
MKETTLPGSPALYGGKLHIFLIGNAQGLGSASISFGGTNCRW